MSPRSVSCCTQGANNTSTIEVDKTWVLPAPEGWTDRQVLLAVGVLADVEGGRARAIRILDVPELAQFPSTIDEVGSFLLIDRWGLSDDRLMGEKMQSH